MQNQQNSQNKYNIKYFGANELRKKFLEFFESKEHLIMDSFPLVPINDKSTLIVSAGMAPFKPYFSGEKIPPKNRVATCQKVVRVNDIENVGVTSRHCTFFEMLGNFSFGDYFKKESLEWTWEFLTKVLEIPEDLLFPSVYHEDDEAYDVWTKDIGLPPEKITRLGKEDNFWELPAGGPCGPCSEVYFDRGEQFGCGPDCKPGCENDCDRFIEVWNNVFTQFNSDGKGNYTPLEKKNIDTGMGLERLAVVTQQAKTWFDIDTMKPVIEKTCEITGIKYNSDEKKDLSVRIIADHIRTATFMICDNIMPSNEGRGYVLRRVLRRAARHGKLLAVKGAFLHDLTDTVIDLSREAYPELEQKREYIKKILKSEEDRFESTINAGLEMLEAMIKKVKENKLNELSGENIFKLYDTYGFPYDLIHEIAEEHKLMLGKEGFDNLMKAQIQRARDARANIAGWIKDRLAGLIGNISTAFDGYSVLEEQVKVLSIIVEDGENLISVDSINEGEFTLILDKTPFYAESGGQVGDVGTITGKNASVNVLDCKKTTDGKIIHICRIEDGEIKSGDEVKASVDAKIRLATARNHSAAHLLQTALREVLGSHVAQEGSYVDSERVRFDFTHFSAMTEDEFARVEQLVNENILAGLAITVTETDMETAKKMGALALFDEKYGDKVRVVKMGNVSCELCGGTHLDNTAKAGLFKILSESSIAAGIRRIEGTTGWGVLDIIKKDKDLVVNTAKILKSANPNDIAKKAESVMSELKERKREIESLTSEVALGKKEWMKRQIKNIEGYKIKVEYLAVQSGDITPESAKIICEDFKNTNEDIVAVIASVNKNDGKIVFTAACGAEAVKAGANAGNLVKQIAQLTGGGGGGRPDVAVAGGKDFSKLDEAMTKGEEILKSMLKQS